MPKKVHFIGINGIGMSGIAMVLLQRGWQISGSDPAESSRTQKLRELGARITTLHAADNVDLDTDCVVYSSAIAQDNAELQKARQLAIPILHRSEMLAKIVATGKGIAIAGAHGKTTTTAMLAHIMLEMFLDPTVVIGGEIQGLQGNAGSGNGEYVVVEADESDGSLVNIDPFAVIITNIDEDHLDHFGNLQNILQTFEAFAARIPSDGVIVLCGDDANNQIVASRLANKVITYGESPQSAYQMRDYLAVGTGSHFSIYQQGQKLQDCRLSIPGVHNALNATGVLALAHQLKLDLPAAAQALAGFAGAKRRFSRWGSYRGADLIDDYAHHPKEIQMTLQAARVCSDGRLFAVFQPHRYSRTQFLYQDFAKAFGVADRVIITEIYSAGELPLSGVGGKMIIDAMDEHARKAATFARDLPEAVAQLRDAVQPGDMIITMGAGDVWKVCEMLCETPAD